MQDISGLSKSAKAEIAEYIKKDNLSTVNQKIQKIIVKDTFYTRYGKRILDIILSFICVVVTLPINIIIGIVTFFDVGFPILFKQQRTGKNEKKFTIYKFRNMTNEKDINGELLPPSQRVTKWGKFVRKTSLDELLNFFSVLKGDMSMIGPRPLVDYYADRLNDRHKQLYCVRPGLECPTLDKSKQLLNWQERFDNYVWYAENCSLFVDIRMCFRIFELVFNRKENARRSQAGSGGFLGYDKKGNVIYTKSVPDKYVDCYLTFHGFESLNDAIQDRENRSE